MIYLKENVEQTILISKVSDFIIKTITLHSEANNTSYNFAVEDLSAFTDYYTVTLNTSGVPTGEYVSMFFGIENETDTTYQKFGTDIFFIGDLENSETQYNNIPQYKEYEQNNE